MNVNLAKPVRGGLRPLNIFGSRGPLHQVLRGEAFINNDAAALAALFTENALLVEPEGVFNGRQAIEKALADLFQRWRPANFISEANKLNAIGNGACAVGQWWCTLESQNGPVPVRGYWSEIYFREGVKRWLGRECDSHLLNFHLSTLNSGGNLSSVVNVTATSSKFRSIIEWRSQHQELKKKGPLRLIFFHSQTCARRRASAHMFWGLRSSRTPPTLSTPGRV